MPNTEISSVPIPLPELRPNPDPTDRTIDQLRREIQMLREVLEQRLDGYDKAIVLIQTQVDREPKPPVLATSIDNLKQLIQKLEDNVNLRFVERDKRNEQMVRDSKALIDATIQSMREAFIEQNRSSQAAIGKSETAIAKQMDQTESKFGTEIGALNGKIDDIKTRITTLESIKVGANEKKDDIKNTWGYVTGAIGMLIALTTIAISVSNTSNRVSGVETQQRTIERSTTP